jgi:hypothetical protein
LISTVYLVLAESSILQYIYHPRLYSINQIKTEHITMSNTREHELDPEEEQDHELNDEDIVEVIEDEGDEPMDDEDDDDNEKYDGEIVIGAPMPGEEEELANMEQMMEDNTLGSTCMSISLKGG